MASKPCRILLDAPADAVEHWREALLDHGVIDELRPAHADLAGYQLIVLDGSQQEAEAVSRCRQLRSQVRDLFVPILFVAPAQSTSAAVAAFHAGADVCMHEPLSEDELGAGVQALLRIKQQHDDLRVRTAEAQQMNQQLEAFHQRVSMELDLARRIQMSLLPQKLPELPGTGFAVHYRPCGRVGGDFYDVFRLDENHVGFYVADAMGHGVPASLLTMFLKRGVVTKEIFDKHYRLVPPSEVLQRLNRDMIEQRLAEQPFITMVYALFNCQDGTFQFARAGHPYPVLIPQGQPPRRLEVPGSLLGVFDTQFPTYTCRLQPGDKVLVYTDGCDAVSFEAYPPGWASVMAGAERHRTLPIVPFVEQLARNLTAPGEAKDDLTILGLEIRA